MSDVLILDVGHGNCTVVNDEGTTAVIDAPRGSTLIDTLNELGVSHVEYALVSHADADHLEGILSLLTSRHVTVGHLYLNPDADRTSTAWTRLRAGLRVAIQKGTYRPHTSLTQTDPGVIRLKDIRLEVVSPSAVLALTGVGGTTLEGKATNANTLSAVIKVERKAGVGVLLAGDMDQKALADILEMDTDLTASALVFPHHGGLPGSGKVADFVRTLLKLVNPSQVYVSNGRNKFDNPRKEVVAAILDHGCALACTQLAKACGDEVENPALERWPSAGRNRQHSCAGTISLTLRETGAIRDASCQALFNDFVSTKVKTPMCKATNK